MSSSSPLEVEIKVRIEDMNVVEERLRKLGANHLDTVHEVDYYLDLRPCLDLKELDMALRVRKRKSLLTGQEVSELSFKGKRISRDVKARKEITVKVEDPEKLVSIFNELGFSRGYTVEKVRKIYTYGSYKIFLDEVKGLGFFIEIELAEGVTDVSIAAERLREVVNALGISAESIVSKTYLELLTEGG